MPKNRVSVPHTVGANDQFVIAGSGQSAPPPGYHRMSTGEIMPNDVEQHGGAPFMFAPGAEISATPVDTGAVMNTDGIAPGIMGSVAGALAAAMGMSTTPEGRVALANTGVLAPDDPIFDEDLTDDDDDEIDTRNIPSTKFTQYLQKRPGERYVGDPEQK